MECKHLVVDFPPEDYRAEEQAGRCRVCGAEVRAKGYLWLEQHLPITKRTGEKKEPSRAFA